jgi:thiamine-monophosphate kinase
MAAHPLGVLLALGVPDRWRSELVALADGVGEALEATDTVILGGNIVAAAALSLTTTVLGSAFAPLTRAGARPGDWLYVTGRLGGPGAALSAWQRGASPAAPARERFAHPSARLIEARWLADRGAAAGIDISDGFAADLEHLAAASGVGAGVELSRLPLASGVDDPVAAAASGEEFELLVSSSGPLDTVEFERRFSIPLTEVGRVTAERAPVILRLNDERVAKPAGYDHLSR